MLAARYTGVVGNMHSVLRDILQLDPRVQLDNESDGCKPPQKIVMPVVTNFSSFQFVWNPNLKEGVMSHPSFGNRFTYTCFVHVSFLPLVTTAVE